MVSMSVSFSVFFSFFTETAKITELVLTNVFLSTSLRKWFNKLADEVILHYYNQRQTRHLKKIGFFFSDFQ